MSFKRLFLAALILIPFQLLGNENHYTLDFSQIEGNALEWFEKNGWAEQVDMDKMNPRFEKGTLVIEPKDDYSGVFFKDFRPDSRQLKGVNKIRIEWGVEQYPEGSDWSGSTDEKRNVRNAIGVMVFFGDEDQDSGVFYVPNIPYFLAFFLGEKERPGKAYLGNYWQKAGRYFCTPCDGKIGEFITEMELPKTFNRQFGFDPPPISGISIDADASNTTPKNGRHSKSFIRKIDLLP